MTTELVHLAVGDGVATITLDSPHNGNALSKQLTEELWAHLQGALGDEAVRTIVLTGTGTVFCSGADLKEQRAANEAGGGGLGPVGVPQILMAMWESPKPIIGRINGPARAGGLGLVAACDISVAVETATFALSEVRIGVIPAVISVVLLPKLGVAKAMELFITGEPFSATDAVAFGITNAAVPEGDLDAAVDGYLGMLRKGAPGAIAGAKQLVRDVPGMPMAEAFERMAELSASYFASDEAKEGMIAFAEKRPPTWAE